MNRIRTYLALSLFCASAVAFGFGGQTPNSQSKTKFVKDYQACMRCKWAKGNTPGKCSNCSAQKSAIRGKLGKYCGSCWIPVLQDNLKCSNGHTKTTMRVLTYYCAKDKTSSSQSGNCTVCGKFRTKYLLIP